jgi:MbtH protein
LRSLAKRGAESARHVSRPETPTRKIFRSQTITNFTSKEKIMSRDEREDNTIQQVVVNHEEQYSIWPADREAPLGWTGVGKSGPKEECLAYIKEVWTDMRPLSLRRKMAETAH